MTIQKLPGAAIAPGTISVVQLESSVATTVQTGGGPKITAVAVTNASYNNLDDTAVDIAGGYIKITGTGFVTGCQVLINNTPATSTTFVSATEVRAQVPATTAGSYIVYLVNPDGGVAIRINGITFSATPTWVTGSTLTGNVDEAISIQLSATSATSYVLAQGSTLPTGLTLTSGGLLSGTVTGLVNDTSYSFTINAIDAENQDSPRSFTITISTNLQVARSLRFNSTDTTYLARTFGSAGNRKLWTLNAWYKRSNLTDTANGLFQYGPDGNNQFRLHLDSAGTITIMDRISATYITSMVTTAVFRDPGAWYHIVLAYDTAQATAADRVKLYINGTQVTSFSTPTYPSQNADSNVCSASSAFIGRGDTTSVYYYSGLITEMYLIDGQALDPTSFAKVDASTGQWIPRRYTGAYGTNGFYLNFSDNSNTTAATLGKDSSGNNNNWTPTNFSVTAGTGNDSMVDSPTGYGSDAGVGGEVRGNYCTWNPLNTYSTLTLSDGALKIAVTEAAYRSTFGTVAFPTTGKWYLEIPLTGSRYVFWGIATLTALTSAVPGSAATGYTVNLGGTQHDKYNNGTVTGNAYTTGALSNPVLKLAYDADSGKLWLGYNTTWFGTSDLLGDPTAGTNPTFTVDTTRQYIVTAGGYNDSQSFYLNSGQRAFAYAAPSGFKALNTHNLPTPNIVKSNTAFDTNTYTGTGSVLTISGYAFAPDLVWIKSRSSASWWHQLQDTVRGATKRLATNDTGVEATDATTLTAFNVDGFSLGTSTSYNENASTYVAWAWDAGSSTVVNTSGTLQSNVRVNTTAGISIQTWTAVSGTPSIGHGLNAIPKFIIIKRRSSAQDWYVYHAALGNNNDYLLLSSTAAKATYSALWGTGHTSTTFSFSASPGDHVSYCFAEVPGFSSFGSYTGNGSADGPFVYTGFRPRFILLKSSSVAATNWQINDTARDSYNVANKRLAPSATDAEATNFNFGDILSNGFKIRQTDQTWNSNGGTYVYAAFAESPFKYARAR